MKSLFIMSSVLFIAACGDDKAPTAPVYTDVVVRKIDGKDGVPGDNGYDALVALDRSNTIDASICAIQSGVIIQTGLDLDRNGTLTIDEVQSVKVVCDGNPGTPAPQYSVASIIDPCGPTPGLQNEVFERLVDGSILVLFADNINGFNPRLSLLQPGSYQTSDGSNCTFTVDSDLKVTDMNGNVFERP